MSLSTLHGTIKLWRQSWLRPSALEELPHLGEEPLMVRAMFGALLRLSLELLQQLPLLRAEVLRRLHRDLNEHVAALGAAQDREPLAAQPELIAGLGAPRDLYLRLA